MTIYSTREEFENLDYFKPTDEFNGVGGYSDVVNLNGIGGYGKYGKEFAETLKTNMVKRIDWSIDCLPNGLIRLFCSYKLDIDKFTVSDFNLYVKEVKE